ncbi:unnamed protein product [Natator depressus]
MSSELHIQMFSVKEEDFTNGMDKARQKASIKAKVLRLQKDLNKAAQEKEGLCMYVQNIHRDPLIFRCKEPERHGCAPGADKSKNKPFASKQLQTIHSSCRTKQKRKPTHPWSDCISNWKEKDCAHSFVLISCCVKMKRFERTSSRGAASGPVNNSRFLPTAMLV